MSFRDFARKHIPRKPDNPKPEKLVKMKKTLLEEYARARMVPLGRIIINTSSWYSTSSTTNTYDDYVTSYWNRP